MRLPIRLRLTLAFALGMALVISGLGAFLYVRLGSELLRAIDLGLRSRAEVLAAGIDQQNVNFGDEPGALVSQADAFAQILDRSGRLVESTDAVSAEPLLPGSLLRTITGPTFTNRAVPGLSEEARLLALPAGDSADRLLVVVGASLGERKAALDRLLVLLLIGGPAALALTSFAGWMLAGAALHPVERMRREAAGISISPEQRLQVPATADEVARLAQTLNAMLDRLEEAFGRERRFVDDASHELRTPLAVLKGEIDLARSRPRTLEELQEALARASVEADHLSRLAEDLFVLSRAHRGQLPVHREDVDLPELVDQATRPFMARADEVGTDLAVDVVPGSARVDPVRLRQAVANLLDNALRHATSGGHVRLRVERPEGGVRITVEDSGPGFPKELLDRVFEPFARGPGRDAEADGAGLGLAIVRAIAQSHGGSATAENLPEGGARVIVTLTG
jgi:two-component system OmpR family sensor kinase